MDTKFTHGQEVIVLDRHGQYEFRGRVMGIHRCNPTMYDIQPNREESLARRMCGLPENQLRPVGRPVLAYERRETNPKHIMDEA
jgi:hypothetical protein